MSTDRNHDFLHSQVEKTEWRKQFAEKIRAELSTEERFKNYFSQFNPSSVQSFIDFYAMRKVSWYEYADSEARYRKYKQTRWYEAAINILKHIQHKKLYNLYCRWFNNEIKLEGIEFSYDLEELRYMPFSNTFIEPVQQHEVDTYIRFIETLSYEDEVEDQQSQVIHTMEFWHKNEEPFEMPEVYPMWYQFFDEHYGTGHLLYLPAPRDKKEEEYKQAFINAQPPVVSAPYIPLKFISRFDTAIFNAFLKKIETPEFFDMHIAARRHQTTSRHATTLDSDFMVLEDAKEFVPIESNSDWREGIAQASEQYQRRKIIEALPYAFEEYNKRLQSGNFNNWQKDHYRDPQRRAQLVERIIQGRLLMGEPGDLNF